MIWACHFEELFKVIGKLSCLVLKVTLNDSDVFFVRVIGLLVMVTLITPSSNGDLLGALLWPLLLPLPLLFTPLPAALCNAPQLPMGAPPSLALDENSFDCLLTRGVSGGDVEKVLGCLRLITIEFVYKGLAASTRPKH
jgi:hypothetical protein